MSMSNVVESLGYRTRANGFQIYIYNMTLYYTTIKKIYKVINVVYCFHECQWDFLKA